MVTDYAPMFEQLLWENARSLLSSGWKREHNPGAPFDFGENHLREHARSALLSGEYIPPPAWPRLVIERKVNGDRIEAGHRHGAIDYFFTQSSLDDKLDLTELLATCEVGGPTRPKLLSGSQFNWYPKILDDIEKQLWRARHAPTVQHCLAVFIRPRSGYDVRVDFSSVLQTMLTGITDAQVGNLTWSERADIRGLHLAIFPVTSRS